MDDEIDADPEVLRREVINRAVTYYRGIEFSPEEYETVMESVGDFADITAADRAYFLLGSYGEEERSRLRQVKRQLNGRFNAYAFLMDDVARSWEQSYAKFRLLADLADYIVGVAEHRCGGFLVEQGYFTAIEPYFQHTYVCTLAYPNDGIREPEHESPYSWMQEGIFDLLDAEQRLLVWRNEDTLTDCVNKIP